MLTNQIAAGITAVVLAVSGVALTAEDDSANVETATSAEVAVNGSSDVTAGDEGAKADLAATTDITISADGTTDVSIAGDDHSSDLEAEAEAEAEAEVESEAGVTGDDDTTSTTTSDDDARQVIEVGLTSYTVGTAGTVVMDGSVLVGVTANPGWSFEIDESNEDRVRVHFQNGEAEAEFDLQVDSRLEITIGG